MIKELVEGIADISASSEEITDDIILLKFTIVNATIVHNLAYNSDHWVLIDTGLKTSYDDILKVAKNYFGDTPPKAIILTHGHFDHIGSVKRLSDYWKVPVYAHELEIPYLTGKKDYPEADTSVDNGLVAKMSAGFPNEGINLGDKVKSLPPDGKIPEMPGWRYIHTPGHTPGHISIYNDTERILIVGDAFSTVKQESLTSVLTQEERISGPPKYFNPDWEAAEKSVKKLKELYPLLVIPSHGEPMSDAELSYNLEKLVDEFEAIGKP